MPIFHHNLIERLTKDRLFRIALTRESHTLFFTTYFRHHMQHPLAGFHHDILRTIEDDSSQLDVVIAFRNSGKTTICSQSFPIWSILSRRKKFVLIISKTEPQIRLILYNIKTELESNPDLLSDYGPFNVGDIWSGQSLVLPKFGARIIGLSAEQSLRGLKHLEQRPDLIILDDVEDLDSVRTYAVREKRYRWFKSEVIPAGSDDCKIVIVGNRLHEESLVSRLKEEIDKKEIKGVYREFPVVKNGTPLWPAKFSDLAALRG